MGESVVAYWECLDPAISVRSAAQEGLSSGRSASASTMPDSLGDRSPLLVSVAAVVDLIHARPREADPTEGRHIMGHVKLG